MKKRSIVLTIAVATLCALPLSAQEVKSQSATQTKEVAAEEIPNPFKNPSKKALRETCSANDAACKVAEMAATEVCVPASDCYKEKRACKRKPECCRRNPFDGIELTSAQKEKLDKANASRKNKRQKMDEKIKKERQKMRSDYMKDLEKILTPEQMTRYKANIEAAKARKAEFTKERKGYVKPGPVVAAPMPQLDYKSK